MSEKLLRVVLLAVACLSLFATCAYGQQDGATWQGGNGNWSTASSWLCNGPDFTNGPAPCVPNGTQFVAGVLNGGTINVDVSPSVFDLIASSNANTSLSLNGTNLTVANEIIGIFGSVTLTNGTITPGNTALSAVNLTMQNSTINGSASVIGADHSLTGTADISGSTIQRLVVGGTFLISNSTLGDNSVFANSGQSSISNTSFNGQLLDESGPLVMDMGSKINSVLFGTPLDVDVALAPNGSATLTIQGGSQLSVSGANLVLGGPQTTTGTVVLNDTSSINASTEVIGDRGTGQFTQNGGTNTISGTLVLGNGGVTGNSGTYNLNGGQLSAVNEIVGYGGTGFFNQNGGTNTISGQLTLGSQAGSGSTGGLLSVDNTYTLSDGNLSAANMVVGDGGHGTFNQNGGTNTISGQLILGNQGGGGGVYNLRGTAALEAGTEIFGSGGGSYNQTGGTNTVQGDLTAAQTVNSSGSYNLSGNDALLKVGGNENLGVEDNTRIEFIQRGGNNEITGNLNVGGTPSLDPSASTGRGYYELDGGLVSVGGSEVILPKGSFLQTGGTNTANHFVLQGTYELGQAIFPPTNGPAVLATTDEMIGRPLLLTGQAVFTQRGGTHTIAGTLTLGDRGYYDLIGGTLTASEIINAGLFDYVGGELNGNFDNEGTFRLSGGGTRVVNGSLTNNGTVEVTADRVVFSNLLLTAGVFKADPTAVEFQNLNVGAQAYITGAAGDTFQIKGNFQNLSAQNTLWDTSSSVLDFTGGGAHEFDLAGHHGLGFSNNFAWGSLVLDPGNILDLAAGSGDALYAFILQGLIVSGTTITNIDGAPGLFLYYDAADNPSLNGNYNLTGGGELIAANGPAPTPEPATLLLFAGGLGSLLTLLKWRGNRKPGARPQAEV